MTCLAVHRFLSRPITWMQALYLTTLTSLLRNDRLTHFVRNRHPTVPRVLRKVSFPVSRVRGAVMLLYALAPMRTLNRPTSVLLCRQLSLPPMSVTAKRGSDILASLPLPRCLRAVLSGPSIAITLAGLIPCESEITPRESLTSRGYLDDTLGLQLRNSPLFLPWTSTLLFSWSISPLRTPV